MLSKVFPPQDISQKLISFNEVRGRFSFSENALRWLIRTRQIPTVRIGRRFYFDPQELDVWIEGHRIPAQGGAK